MGNRSLAAAEEKAKTYGIDCVMTIDEIAASLFGGQGSINISGCFLFGNNLDITAFCLWYTGIAIMDSLENCIMFANRF